MLVISNMSVKSVLNMCQNRTVIWQKNPTYIADGSTENLQKFVTGFI